MADAKSTPKPVVVNVRRGLLFASAVVPLGVAAWVILWQAGFIASLVAFGVSFGAVALYKKGSGDTQTRRVVVPLLIIIGVTIILAFLAGMVSDGWAAYAHDLGSEANFWSEDFWGFIGDNLSRGELWSQYINDILMSLLFAALGAGGVVMELVGKGKQKA